MKVYKSFKYELRLTREQKEIFYQSIGICRFVWNKALALKKRLWEENKQKISLGKLDKYLTIWKQQNDWMFIAPSQALQQVLKDLDKAFKSFFNGMGYPRFKKKGVENSFRLTQGQSLEGQLSKKVGLIKLPKLGLVRFTKTRNLEGVLKCSTISTKAGKWYISFCCEIEINPQPGVNNSKIGIDRGVNKRVQCSNGEFLSKFIPSKNKVKRIKWLQKKLEKKEEKSSNRKKIVRKIQKNYIHLYNARRDAIHKFTTKIAKSHGTVVLEELKIKNMTKSAKGSIDNPGKNVKAKSGLNRVILEQSWRIIADLLKYKMLWNGGSVFYVDARFTSQKCFECKHISKENRKTQAKFKCVQCGYTSNADLNASKNILDAHLVAEGQAALACGEEILVSSVKQEP